MICLHTTSTSASTSATMTHAMPSHNDLILRALEREREALLAKTHAAFSYYEHSPYAELDSVVVDADADDDDDDEDDDEYECDNAPRYDTRGRQAAFRETVRQRQARLEFLRRQDAARRRVSRTRKSEEIVVASLSRSVFYPASSSSSSYSPSTSPSTSTSTSTSTSSDSSSDSDSLAELEPDSDSEDEWDAPTPRVHLYVVVDEEEEEEEEEEDDDYTFSVTAIHSRSRYEQSKPMTQPQSPPRRQIARSSPSSPRSPVARVPSLESIPERPELEA